VDDQADVVADPHRPEIRIFRPVKLVELHAGIGRVHLEVESRGLDRFLLLPGELRKALGKGIGNAEFHHLLHAKDFHHLVAEVVDHLDRDPARSGLGKWA